MNSKNKSVCISAVLVFLIVFFAAIQATPTFSQNSGSFAVKFASAQSNSTTGCFASSNGWNKYIVMTNIFIGPNYSGGQLPSGGVPNTKHCTNLIVNLCNSANGSNFVGEFYVVNNFHPNDGEAKCGTNNPNCSSNTNCSADTITMTNAPDASYRVDVIYKSSTTNGLTNIMVNWAYTNL